MKKDLNLENSYSLLIDTLIMTSLDFEKVSEEEIESCIEELEGDYYTFFDHINLIPFQCSGLLNELQVEQIVALKQMMNNIPANLWNKTDFINNSIWIKVRERADNLLISLGISKRVIN